MCYGWLDKTVRKTNNANVGLWQRWSSTWTALRWSWAKMKKAAAYSCLPLPSAAYPLALAAAWCRLYSKLRLKKAASLLVFVLNPPLLPFPFTLHSAANVEIRREMTNINAEASMARWCLLSVSLPISLCYSWVLYVCRASCSAMWRSVYPLVTQ